MKQGRPLQTQLPNEQIKNRNILTAARGSGVLAFGRFFDLGGRLIVALILARLLGAEQYGVYNLVMSAATLATAIGVFGLDDAMLRYVAIYAGRKDDARLWGAILLGVVGTFLVGSLAGLGLYLLADWISVTVFHEPALAPILRLMSLAVPFMSLSNILVGIAHGFKRMEYSVLAQDVGQLLIRLLLLGVLSFSGLSAMLAALVFGVSDVLACVALIYLLNRDFAWNRPIQSAHLELREIFNYALPLWLSGMIAKLRNNINTIVLGALSTPVNVGVYSLITRVNLVGHVSYLSIIRSVKPLLAELSSRDDREQLASIYQTTTRWTLVMNLPMFLVLVLFPSQVLSVFGGSFATGTAALIILAWAELFNAGTGICGSIIDMSGHTRLKLVNSISQISILIGLNVLLIPRWGMIGTALAVMASLVFVNVLRIVEVWVLFRILPYNRTFTKPLLSAAAAAAVALGTANLVGSQPALVQLAVGSLAVFVVMAGALLALGLTPEDRMVTDKVTQRLHALYTRQFASITRFITAKLP